MFFSPTALYKVCLDDPCVCMGKEMGWQSGQQDKLTGLEGKEGEKKKNAFSVSVQEKEKKKRKARVVDAFTKKKRRKNCCCNIHLTFKEIFKTNYSKVPYISTTIKIMIQFCEVPAVILGFYCVVMV